VGYFKICNRASGIFSLTQSGGIKIKWYIKMEKENGKDVPLEFILKVVLHLLLVF